MLDKIHDGYHYSNQRPNTSIDSVAIVFNHVNNHGHNYFQTNIFTSSDISGIVFDGPSWQRPGIVLHEYGHNVQYSFQHARIPEATGFHRLAKRYNPHLAYSEGWSHYFATAVTNNPAVMVDFDLSAYVTHITKKCLFCHCEERSDEAISSGCLS